MGIPSDFTLKVKYPKNRESEMVRIIEVLQSFEITLKGGFAIYALLSIVYTTVFGLISILHHTNPFKK